jgi:hypothetical protein
MSYEKGNIDWNEKKHGKLWAYILNYMDYLLQHGMGLVQGVELIKEFIRALPANFTGLEPYPISLRGINWIKFLSRNNINDPEINQSLYSQYQILAEKPEYHLLGNHLLENGFSMLFGAFYFNDKHLYIKAKKIIEKELYEQILSDGAHFELSPMYHQIILEHLFDCINLVLSNNRFSGQELLVEFMKEKAVNMLYWIKEMTFSNGNIPMLNDSASGISPTTRQLIEYAATLNIKYETLNLKLSSCGYRKFSTGNYECVIDIGQIGPSYQPGHAHADTFNFVLNINTKPLIIDTGISTYEMGEIRLNERGTAAHNTVTVQDKNSSEVWSSFRVARRANVKILNEDEKSVIAQHNGYRRLGTIHQREWKFSEKQLIIVDTLLGKISQGKMHLWLSPQSNPKKNGNIIEIGNVTVNFDNADSIALISTQIPNGFNRTSSTFKIEIIFRERLITLINL